MKYTPKTINIQFNPFVEWMNTLNHRPWSFCQIEERSHKFSKLCSSLHIQCSLVLLCTLVFFSHKRGACWKQNILIGVTGKGNRKIFPILAHLLELETWHSKDIAKPPTSVTFSSFFFFHIIFFEEKYLRKWRVWQYIIECIRVKISLRPERRTYNIKYKFGLKRRGQ